MKCRRRDRTYFLREDIKEMEKSNIMIRLEKKEEQQKVVLEPGGINHSESSRNNQSELIRNSQCTCLADRLPTVIQLDR